MRFISLLVVALLLAGASTSASAQASGATVAQGRVAELIGNSKQFIPSPEFEAWYNEVLIACKRTGDCQTSRVDDFAEIVWFQYKDAAIPCGPAQRCDGQALIGANMIFLSPRAFYDRRVVKHEMLHLILGTGDHPQVFDFLNLGRE